MAGLGERSTVPSLICVGQASQPFGAGSRAKIDGGPAALLSVRPGLDQGAHMAAQETGPCLGRRAWVSAA